MFFLRFVCFALCSFSGIQFSLSKYNRYGQVSKARQNKIERIIDSLSKIHHRDLKPRVDQDVEIVETPDPIEIYIVTDETNLLIFEQEVNRYNERNGNVGDPPPIMYEQMSPGDKESFFMHLLLSDESNDIFKQVIFDHATCEEKEVCISMISIREVFIYCLLCAPLITTYIGLM